MSAWSTRSSRTTVPSSYLSGSIASRDWQWSLPSIRWRSSPRRARARRPCSPAALRIGLRPTRPTPIMSLRSRSRARRPASFVNDCGGSGSAGPDCESAPFTRSPTPCCGNGGWNSPAGLQPCCHRTGGCSPRSSARVTTLANSRPSPPNWSGPGQDWSPPTDTSKRHEGPGADLRSTCNGSPDICRTTRPSRNAEGSWTSTISWLIVPLRFVATRTTPRSCGGAFDTCSSMNSKTSTHCSTICWKRGAVADPISA